MTNRYKVVHYGKELKDGRRKIVRERFEYDEGKPFEDFAAAVSYANGVNRYYAENGSGSDGAVLAVAVIVEG